MGIEVESRQFGTATDLRELVGLGGLLVNLDAYRPRALVSHPNGPAVPFSGCFIYAFMTCIALAGRFNIWNSIFGLQSAGFIRGQIHARLIPSSTWATGMLLVSPYHAELLPLEANYPLPDREQHTEAAQHQRGFAQ